MNWKFITPSDKSLNAFQHTPGVCDDSVCGQGRALCWGFLLFRLLQPHVSDEKLHSMPVSNFVDLMCPERAVQLGCLSTGSLCLKL